MLYHALDTASQAMARDTQPRSMKIPENTLKIQQIVNLSWVPVMDGSHEGQCRLI